MPTFLSIGDFSRASHLTVKTLRHYHEVGLLVPAEVHPETGYRRYVVGQLSTARVIRRLRDVDMPLEQIHAVLTAPDVEIRNERLAAHLTNLESDLERVSRAVRSLADLLLTDPSTTEGAPNLRTVSAVSAAVIKDVVAAEDAVAWLQGALGEIHGTLTAQQVDAAGPAGGVYEDAMFTEHHGGVTVFVPCTRPVRPVGRVRPERIPGGEFAMLTHPGPPAEVDRTYAQLAAFVARHTLAVDGPIREYYRVGPQETADNTQWRTDIAWPVFITATPQPLRA